MPEAIQELGAWLQTFGNGLGGVLVLALVLGVASFTTIACIAGPKIFKIWWNERKSLKETELQTRRIELLTADKLEKLHRLRQRSKKR